jgi:hypothetical protein
MPTYLCHGFRWQRQSVRVFVVVQDLEDASPEWIIPAKSSRSILESFYNLFDFLPYCEPPRHNRGGGPYGTADSDDDDGGGGGNYGGGRNRSQSVGRSGRNRSQSQSRQQVNAPQLPPVFPHAVASAPPEDDVRSQDWSTVKLLEEYDPMNLEEMSRPYTYVADHVVRIDLSVSIMEEIQRYEERLKGERDPPMTGGVSDETGRKKANKKPGWFEKLRDQLQRGEEIKWYVVVNGDEVREWPDEPVRAPTATKQQQQQQQYAQSTRPQLILPGNEGETTRAQQQPSRGRDAKATSPLKSKASMDGGLRPKTPSKGGFRKLFGKTKPEGYSP